MHLCPEEGGCRQVIVSIVGSSVGKVYKQIYVSAAINGTHDTTVCYTTNPVPISVTTSIVVTKLSWTTSGTGTFSNNGTSATTTTYTPSAADKASGSVTLTVTASTSLNANGNCGTATAIDNMILRIYPRSSTGNNRGAPGV